MAIDSTSGDSRDPLRAGGVPSPPGHHQGARLPAVSCHYNYIFGLGSGSLYPLRRHRRSDLYPGAARGPCGRIRVESRHSRRGGAGRPVSTTEIRTGSPKCCRVGACSYETASPSQVEWMPSSWSCSSRPWPSILSSRLWLAVEVTGPDEIGAVRAETLVVAVLHAIVAARWLQAAKYARSQRARELTAFEIALKP